MKKALSIHVRGKVQGVFFRASTREEADRLGVAGFVRNEPDGSVYIEAEADPAVLDQFLSWCRNGPPRAAVQECAANEISVKGFSGFRVER